MQPKVDIPRAIPRSRVKKAPPPLTTHLKLPSLARELPFGAFLQTGQLHFLWVSSPPCAFCSTEKASKAQTNTRDHIVPRGGCPLPPRCSLGADIKLLSNGTSFPFNPLYSHFARWLPWNSSSGGQFLLPGDSALCKHKRILSKSFKASTSDARGVSGGAVSATCC